MLFKAAAALFALAFLGNIFDGNTALILLGLPLFALLVLLADA